ncbi:glycosyltransferase family 4 protein [Rhizobium sp. FKL33]|uniref:glycosyltransferase family 4 protein n=1 Tax=Rhizobium sp. FKL33 TaxID=2562307 RepID=UPI0024849D2B|nr:glycosyltransferase family 4 protein [Rhizobium sp. FKL33]
MENGPRILHLIHTPRHSGAESLVRDLSLIGMEQGVPTAIASFAPCETPFEADRRHLQEAGVKLYFPDHPLTRSQRLMHYRKSISAFLPDTIFGHSVLPSFYGRFANSFRKPKSKFVSVLHSASNDDYGGKALHLSELLSRIFIDAVVAVSDQGKKNYIRRFGENVPVHVIRNGIDLKKFENLDRVNIRQKLGIPDTKKVVIQVGRIAPVKQQHLSYQALRGVLEDLNIELWYVGLTENKAYQSMLRREIEGDGLAAFTSFLGSRDDVHELLAAADVFVMPSLAEAHSVAMLEALVSGLPVVASDIAAFSFVKDCPGVHLIPPTDENSLRSLVTENLRTGLIEREKEGFSIKKTFSLYKKLF